MKSNYVNTEQDGKQHLEEIRRVLRGHRSITGQCIEKGTRYDRRQSIGRNEQEASTREYLIMKHIWFLKDINE